MRLSSVAPDRVARDRAQAESKLTKRERGRLPPVRRMAPNRVMTPSSSVEQEDTFRCNEDFRCSIHRTSICTRMIPHEVDEEHGRLHLMISIFGRATPIEIEFLEVEWI